jgi:hypothetical protein
MTICDIPWAIKAALHESCFPANTKAGFHVLEFILLAGIFFKSKNLWKLRFQIELSLLWRLQFPVATVNVLPFLWFSRKIISYFKSSNTTCLPRGCSKPFKSVVKKSKNANRANENCQFDWYLWQKWFDTQCYGRIAVNERRIGPKK